MSCTSIVLGLIGDAFTFGGGTVLAWDAIKGKTHYKRAKTIKLALDDPVLKGRLIEIEGRTINTPEAVDEVFIHFSSLKAKIGYVILAFGFLFLLAHRIAELCE
ncbi:MAG TPA: hypothetical protein VIJ01_10395 [Candidatus Angelobacter sp.]